MDVVVVEVEVLGCGGVVVVVFGDCEGDDVDVGVCDVSDDVCWFVCVDEGICVDVWDVE